MKPLFHSACLLSLVLISLAATSLSAQEKKPPKITYEEHIKPIFRQKCLSCHNPDKKSGDLDLTNYTNMMQGGGSGEVVERGDASASYLYLLVTHESEPYMPPQSPKLPDEMVETIRKWIDGGALENAGSKAFVRKKPKFDLALKDAPTGRPEVPAMPPKLSMEPVVHTPATTAVTALATSPWAPLAAVAGQKQILLYNTKTLEMLGALSFPEGIPQVLKFSRNGNLLLAGGGQGGASGKVIVWNVATGERVIEVGDELDEVLAADISADQTLIALGGPQKVVRIYSTETGQMIHELRKHTDWVCSVEFSPDGVLLATGDRNGGLFVWEGWTGREYLALKGHTGCVTAVSWRADSNVVASCSEDASVRLWEMENGGQIKSWGAHGGGTTAVEFARDGRIITCGRDRTTKLWKADGAALRTFEAFGDLALRVTLCDETNRAIAGDWKGEIRVWDANDGKRLGNLTANPPVLAARLITAQQDLAAKKAAHAPLAAAYQAVLAAANKLKADLAASQKAMTDNQQKATAATAKVNTATQQVAAATTALDSSTKALAAMQPVVPALNQSVTAAQAAAAKAPADKELADAVAKLAAVAKVRAEQMDGAAKAKTTQTTALATAKTQLAAAQKEVADATAAVAAAKAKVDQLTPMVKPADDKVAPAKQAADAAAQAIAAAEGQVTRWQQEIEFAVQIKRLIEERQSAADAFNQQQAAHLEMVAVSDQAAAAASKAAADVNTANAQVATVQKDVEAKTAAVAAAKKAETDAVAAHQAAVAAVTKLTGALPALQQLVTMAATASGKLKEDKELADVAMKLTALQTAKQTQLKQLQSDVAVKLKAVDAGKQRVATATQQLTAANAAFAAAQKRVVDLDAVAKGLAAKAAEAKKVTDAKGAEVAAAQQQLEAVNGRITEARGIGQANAS